MPPFQNSSTGASRIVRIRSCGVKVSVSVASARRASGDMVIDLTVRGQMPPPGLIRLRS